MRVALMLGASLISVGLGASVAQIPVQLYAGGSDGGSINLAHWPTSGWYVQQYDNLVEIRFPDAELEIVADERLLDDLEGKLATFQTEVIADTTYLRLTLACECSVSVMGEGNSSLRIDLVDGSDRRLADQQGPAPLLSPHPVAKPGSPDVLRLSADTDELNADAVREQILDQLVRAAEAGVIELEDGVLPDAEAQPQSPDTMTDEQTAQAPEVDDVEQAQSDIAEPSAAVVEPEVETPANPIEDLALTEAIPLQPQCFSLAAFEFPELADSGSFSAKIAEERGILVGEFDRPESENVLSLARTYLAVGSAPEAQALLRELLQRSPEGALLYDIGEVLRNEHVQPGSSLRKSDCLGDQALWRALVHAADGEIEMALAAEEAAGRALERLPIFLREFAAAKLGRAAVTNSNWSAARRFQAVAQRAAIGLGGESGELLLLSAALAQWHDDDRSAKDYLVRARDTRPSVSDLATLKLADLALSSEEFVGEDMSALREDLGAVALRGRGSDIGAGAFEREARLLQREVSSDQIIGFLSQGVASGLFPAEKHLDLLSELASRPAMSELSRPLAVIFLEKPERFEAILDQAPFRHALLQSFAEIGVPNLALPYVRSGDLGTPTVAVSLVNAFLEAGDPREALEIAQTMPAGDEREQLTAAALVALGQREQVSDSTLAGSAGQSMELLRQRFNSASEAGEHQEALATALDMLEVEPAAAQAERAVLAALQAGEASMPEAVRVVLADQPDRLAQLNLLFRSIPEEPDPQKIGVITEFLDDLDDEISLIEGYLSDG